MYKIRGRLGRSYEEVNEEKGQNGETGYCNSERLQNWEREWGSYVRGETRKGGKWEEEQMGEHAKWGEGKFAQDANIERGNWDKMQIGRGAIGTGCK